MPNYLYASGRIRALETTLLNATDIERMVDAPDAGAAFKVFNDTEFADNLLDVEPESFVAALNDDAKQLKELLLSLVTDPHLLRFLFLKNDVRNAKLAVKGCFAQQDLERYSSVGSFGTVGHYQAYLQGNGEPPRDRAIRAALDEAREQFTNDTPPHELDVYMDHLYFRELQKTAVKIGSRYLCEFVQFQIDFTNLKILFRSQRLKRNETDVTKEFLPGGKIPVSTLREAFVEEVATATRLVAQHLTRQWEPILEQYAQGGVLWQMEKTLEELELDFLRLTKQQDIGPELVVAYYYAKRNAARNVRIIMTGKLNGLPQQQIRERLRRIW